MSTPYLLGPTERLNIFLITAGDVDPERKFVLKVLKVINSFTDSIDVFCWEDTIPLTGKLPQQHIEDQIPIEKCHIIVAIFWHRFGRPTGQKRADGTPYNSGVERELDRAIEVFHSNENGLPWIIIYRKEDDPLPLIKDNPDDIIQYGRLLEYLKQFPPEQSWVYPVASKDFEDTIIEHLCTVLRDMFSSRFVGAGAEPLATGQLPSVTSSPANTPTTLPATQPEEKTSEPQLPNNWARKVGLMRITIETQSVPPRLIGTQELREKIKEWMTSLSEDKRVPYISVGQLCDSSSNLDKRIDEEIVDLAQGSPRLAQELIEGLFALHSADPHAPMHIQTATWEQFRFNHMRLAHAGPAATAVEDFRLAGPRIYFGKRQVVLTPLLQKLLRKLLEARGEICTYDELTKVGWPTAVNADGVSHNALQEAMRRLRSELLAKYGIDAKLWIETYRADGYRLRLLDELAEDDATMSPGAAHSKGEDHVH